MCWWVGGDVFGRVRGRVCVDGAEGEAESAVVGCGGYMERVADYVVEFDVLCKVVLAHQFPDIF